MSEIPPQSVTINGLLNAVYPSFALMAGMELDLFTPLNDGPLTAEQLASVLDVQPIKLRPLLYALVVCRLLNVDDDLFSNTAEASHYLVRDRPPYLGQVQGLTANNWNRLRKIAQTIRAGGPVDQDDSHKMSQEELSALLRGLHPYAVADAQALMARYDFSGARSLLDAGGGSGGLAITMVRANPYLKGTIVDLPLVTPITRQFVEEAGVARRIEVQTADAVNEYRDWLAEAGYVDFERFIKPDGASIISAIKSF